MYTIRFSNTLISFQASQPNQTSINQHMFLKGNTKYNIFSIVPHGLVNDGIWEIGVFQIRVHNIYYMWRQGNSKNEIGFVTKYESCVFH